MGLIQFFYFFALNNQVPMKIREKYVNLDEFIKTYLGAGNDVIFSLKKYILVTMATRDLKKYLRLNFVILNHIVKYETENFHRSRENFLTRRSP